MEKIKLEFVWNKLDMSQILGKRVILFGAGYCGKDYYLQICESDVLLVDWVASREKIVFGRKIHHVSTIVDKEYDFVIIAIKDAKTAEEMRTQLQELHVPSEKIIWKYPLYTNGRLEYDKSWVKPRLYAQIGQMCDEIMFQTEYAKVFSLLEERFSQKMLWARMRASLQNNPTPLFKLMMEQTEQSNSRDMLSLFYDRMNNVQSCEIIIFGTSYYAWEINDIANDLGILIDYICEEDDFAKYSVEKTHPQILTGWGETQLISIEELIRDHSSANVVLGVSNANKAREHLIQSGFPEEQLYYMVDGRDNRPYFDQTIVHPHEHEVFFDCGCYDLRSAIDFSEWCNGKYDHIYSLEPDPVSYEKCVIKMEKEKPLDSERVTLLPVAAWKKNEAIYFKDGNGEASKVSASGNTRVEGQSIDSILCGNRVSFIKMDIEGAELEALKGARESIKKWKPRLAISVYHKPEDITEIPLYIHELVPEYKMYLRQYFPINDDTVLYCVMDDQ